MKQSASMQKLIHFYLINQKLVRENPLFKAFFNKIIP